MKTENIFLICSLSCYIHTYKYPLRSVNRCSFIFSFYFLPNKELPFSSVGELNDHWHIFA